MPGASKELLTALPEWMQDRLARAGKVADMLGMPVYLVGGIVRDLLLGYPSTDIDLVIEGDGIAFSKRLSRIYEADLKHHSRFGTATLTFSDGTKVDVATARSERYDAPAALPIVKADTFQHDLQRRDFTINAMAVCLNEEMFGHLVDLYGGLQDLDAGLIRVLHPQSFIDDPTRLLRAVRFEQRLGFALEESTYRLFEEAVRGRMIDRLSDDRLREQLRLIFNESDPWPVAARLDSLDVLAAIASDLQTTDDMRLTFEAITRWRDTSPVPAADMPVDWELYLLGMASACPAAIPQLIDRLKPERRVADGLRRLPDLHSVAENVSKGTIGGPSAFYVAVHMLPPDIVFLFGISHTDDSVRQRCMAYHQTHRHIRLFIDGHTLNSLGIPEGPVYGDILNDVLKDRIDGIVNTEQEERARALEIWKCNEKNT